MTADLLRRAAALLRDPHRNTTAWDVPLADWLDAEADGHAAVQGVGAVVGGLLVQMSGTEVGTQIKHSTLPQALAVARAVLREPEPDAVCSCESYDCTGECCGAGHCSCSEPWTPYVGEPDATGGA